jgi:hypothetical protein
MRKTIAWFRILILLIIIVLCPFTISVYTVRDEPGTVRLSYRTPTGRPGTEEIIEEVVALIESSIVDATW